MDLKIAPEKEPKSLAKLTLLGALELFISGVATLLIAPDPKNAFIFGLSPLRLALVVGIWVLAGSLLADGILARKRVVRLESVWLVDQTPLLRNSVYALSFLLILWGWLALFCSPDLFGRRIYIFQRIQPVSVAVGVVLAQFWIFFLYSRGRLDFHGEARRTAERYTRPALLFAAVLVAVEIFIIASRFGLLSNIIGIYADVVGIPLTGLQWFLIILAGCLWIALIWPQDPDLPFLRFLHKYRLIPVLLFLAALLTWGLTPMASHFFSPAPAAPSYQPFPFSDARTFDEGGISILRGFGVYFRIMIDKPLYMILLAALHGIAGSDYRLLLWLQIMILAFIPVALYCLGQRFHSRALGFVLALTLIIRQRNAMVLSNKVSTTNPKLLMSEEITLLVMVLIVYLAFRWIRERRLWQAALCGALIGVGALVRLNPLFLFPALAVLVLPLFWGQGKKFLLRQFTAYTLAFIVVLLPWLIGSVDSQGTPWLLSRARLVIYERYGQATPTPPPGATGVTPSGGSLPRLSQLPSVDVKPPQQGSSADLPGGSGARFFYHFLHNYSTSVMALPLSLVYTDLDRLAQRPYWQDGDWQGNLTLIEWGFILANLLLTALGLAYAWRNFRWAGMVPLVIYLGYDLSLGFAMDSGGRYLVPIDWIIYLYYFLAIIALARFALSYITGKQGPRSTMVEPAATVHPKAERWALNLTIGLVVFLAVLFPITNSVIPALHSPVQERPEVREAVLNVTGQEPQGTMVVYGEILYPYFTKGVLSFVLITSAGAVSYEIPDPGNLVDQVHDEEYAFVALRPVPGGPAQIQSVYLWQDEVPALAWKSLP